MDRTSPIGRLPSVPARLLGEFPQPELAFPLVIPRAIGGEVGVLLQVRLGATGPLLAAPLIAVALVAVVLGARVCRLAQREGERLDRVTTVELQEVVLRDGWCQEGVADTTILVRPPDGLEVHQNELRVRNRLLDGIRDHAAM